MELTIKTTTIFNQSSVQTKKRLPEIDIMNVKLYARTRRS